MTLNDLTKCVQDAMIGCKCSKCCIGKENALEEHFYEFTNNATDDKACCKSIVNCVNRMLHLCTEEEILCSMEKHDEEVPNDNNTKNG